MKNVMQIIETFFQKPLFIEETAFRMILAAFNAATAFPAAQAAFGVGRNDNRVTVTSGVAVVPVMNILSYRSLDGWSYLFGGTAYQEIRENFHQALGNNDVSTIVLDVASPGGTGEGLFDLVDEIYQARAVKPIYAMVNESALSAAYAIASAAEKVFIPRTGNVGSIGIKAVHIDISAAEKKAGLKFTEIHAGDHKIDGTPHAPLTDKARAVYQKVVDQNYDLLVKTIARNRGLQPASVRDQQAAIYTGKEAIAAGLADSVLSWDAAWKRVVGLKPNKGGSAMKTKLQALFSEAPIEIVDQSLWDLGYVAKLEQSVILSAEIVEAISAALGMTVEQFAGDLSTVDFKAARDAALGKVKDETRKDILAYALAIHEICLLAGQEKMAAALISAETGIEDVRAKVLAQKAEESQKTLIRSTIGGTVASEVSRLW